MEINYEKKINLKLDYDDAVNLNNILKNHTDYELNKQERVLSDELKRVLKDFINPFK